jgi:molybdopterin/thiamine biosynthesis adenylyltransferase
VVIDALDNIDARKILARSCAALNIPLVHGAIRGWYAQVTVILPDDGDVMERLYPESAKVTDKTCLAFTPALCAALQVSECVKLLCGRDAPLRGKLLSADLLDQEFDKVPML